MDEDARLQLLSIIDALSPEDKRSIAELSEDRVIKLHHGLGTHIRNMIRAGELGALFRWAQTQVPPEAKSLDDRAWPIVFEFWKALREGIATRACSRKV